MRKNYYFILNLTAIVGILLILVVTYGIQFFLHITPCPLCLLQRIGFVGAAFGFLLNLKFGSRPSHYAIALLSSLLIAILATQQVFYLNIHGPDVTDFPVLGLHLYSWALVASSLMILFSAIMLLFEEQFLNEIEKPSHRMKRCIDIMFLLLFLLAIANAVTALIK